MKNLKKKIRIAFIKFLFGDLPIGGINFHHNQFGNNVRDNNFVIESDLVMLNTEKVDSDFEVIIRRKKIKQP